MSLGILRLHLAKFVKIILRLRRFVAGEVCFTTKAQRCCEFGIALEGLGAQFDRLRVVSKDVILPGLRVIDRCRLIDLFG